MNSDRIHLRGLNGIRALAALTVLLFHTASYLPNFNLGSFSFWTDDWAGYSVTLFFVLSGFLITYLLTMEKTKTGTIHLKNFYVRRILRIWPVYFMAILLTLALVPFVPTMGFLPGTGKSLVFYLCFFPNVAYSYGFAIVAITPLWSVGVEQQFYAFWPMLMKKSGSLKKSFCLVILAYWLLKLGAKLYGNDHFYHLVSFMRFDCMAIGGLGAVWLKEKSRVIQWAYHPLTQIAAWGLFVYATFFKPVLVYSFIDHDLYAFIFLIMILNVSTNPKTLVDLENRVMDYLGKISYGLYCYHLPVICVLMGFHIPSCAVLFSLVLFFSVAIASISYFFYERPFIKMKDGFSDVLSQSSMTLAA
jgi:peptidoglycan/LPS O-acetylase OafA/YrhL